MFNSIKQFINSGNKESSIHKHAVKERADLYHSIDNQSIELEYGLLIQSLVIAIKPKLILETGTHKGISTEFLVNGCLINGFGKIITVEQDKVVLNIAKERLIKHKKIIQFNKSTSISYITSYDPKGTKFDFALLDSDFKARILELKLLLTKRLFNPGALIFIHDTSKHRNSEDNPTYPEFVSELNKFNIKNIECNFSRGFRLFQI